jgi:hypothetical protein
MNHPLRLAWQAHPVLHPPVEAPPNDQGIIWIDEVPYSPPIDKGFVATVSIVALGSAWLLLGPMTPMPAMGASRSTRLKWVSRQAEIEQALAEQQAFLQNETEGGSPPPGADRTE